jgi:hypothetical protein
MPTHILLGVASAPRRRGPRSRYMSYERPKESHHISSEWATRHTRPIPYEFANSTLKVQRLMPARKRRRLHIHARRESHALSVVSMALHQVDGWFTVGSSVRVGEYDTAAVDHASQQ